MCKAVYVQFSEILCKMGAEFSFHSACNKQIPSPKSNEKIWAIPDDSSEIKGFALFPVLAFPIL